MQLQNGKPVLRQTVKHLFPDIAALLYPDHRSSTGVFPVFRLPGISGFLPLFLRFRHRLYFKS